VLVFEACPRLGGSGDGAVIASCFCLRVTQIRHAFDLKRAVGFSYSLVPTSYLLWC
jgi:hypothetical protein